MTKPRLPDAVDTILAQWRRERPELDVTPMGPIGRLKRCSAIVQRRLDETFAAHGLTFWEFDVLATLRRAGKPYCLAPTVLFATLMVTSGTMTNRLQRLEASGWVERLPNPEDARSMLVRLTPTGFALIDRAVPAHVENERQILCGMTAADLRMLDRLLSRLLTALES